MDNITTAIPTTVAFLLNLVVPLVYGFIKNPVWSKSVNRIVAIALSLVVSAIILVIYYASIGFHFATPQDIAQVIILGLATSQAAYSLGLKEISDEITEPSSTDTK